MTGQDLSLSTFGAERKTQFLEMLRIHYPNVGKVCKVIGITRATFYNHYNQDGKFKELIDQIKEDRMDDIEAVMQANAVDPKFGFLDRIATLRAHRPALYNPAQKVIVERQDHLTIDVAKQRVDRLRTVIDADIVETYDKRNLPPA